MVRQWLRRWLSSGTRPPVLVQARGWAQTTAPPTLTLASTLRVDSPGKAKALLAEVNNGRLAMIGIFGKCTRHRRRPRSSF